MFFRAGANRIVNHGFSASPERDIAPTRKFYAAIHVSPDNIWWPHYRRLSDYITRCSYLLRQGNFHADVAIYSPVASQWAKDAFDARKWTRNFDWGGLSQLLISNGYAFDLVNDDALQRLASFDGPRLNVGDMTYRVLLVPNITALPLESFQQIAAYAAQGGVVVALERVPEAACGLVDWQKNDLVVQDLATELFKVPVWRGPLDRVSGKRTYGDGTTYWFNRVMDRSEVLDRHNSALDPFLKVLAEHVKPDMSIDYVREDMRRNEGLCFIHRSDGERDYYFVSNVQDRPVNMPIGFRVTDAAPTQWDPYTGTVTKLNDYEERDGAIHLPVDLAPYESTFYVFEKGQQRPHATFSTLAWIDAIDEEAVTGWTNRAGDHIVGLGAGETLRTRLQGMPAPLRVAVPWQLTLESPVFEKFETELETLRSWTDLAEARHFSGIGTYTAEFNVPQDYLQDNMRLFLDLGDVGNVAEVELNGESAGVVWMKGQRLEITDMPRAGENYIEVRVTNTLINRVAGLSEFPEVPEALQARLGKARDDRGSPAHALLGFEPLPRSGLLGPVEIHPYRRLKLNR
jgi:hypothetical protein